MKQLSLLDELFFRGVRFLVNKVFDLQIEGKKQVQQVLCGPSGNQLEPSVPKFNSSLKGWQDIYFPPCTY